ncbi:glutathione S-transferase omega-1-like isoform X2 [Ornithodoros turicata]|uniref:glutathione S-transferase omega-1-like isoform X2 n=1 Tax=Ornithodoros turicata TaxID=34597 RepID=UPI003138BE53
MTLKAYKAGSQFPPLQPGKLRIYSMRFCPFAHRALIVLAAKNIDHEIVNIDLKNKPDWFLNVHPVGKVPVLQQDDKVINESLILSEYLDEAYGSSRLLPTDPYLKARDKMFLEVGCSAATSVVKIYYNNEDRLEIWSNWIEKLKVIEEELALRKTPYLSGARAGFTDYMTWPFFPRAAAFSAVFPELKMPSPSQYPLLVSWMNLMKNDPAVVAVINEAHLVEYTKCVLNGIFDYDVGL